MRSSNVVIFLFLLLVVSDATFSQSTTNSPYSKYGIGVIRPQSFGQNFALGGVGIGLRSNRSIGFQNPASYSEMGATTFDLGYTNNALWLDDGTETQYQNNPYIDHLAFAFPIIKNTWGLSFGVLPHSNIGYNYDEVISDSIAGDISFYNEGSGAINKVYIGNGFGINLDTTSIIAFGANTYYMFGSITHDQKAIYGDLTNSFNIWKLKEISVADFGVDFGLQYQKSFTNSKDEKINFTLGVTYGLAANLDAKRTEILRTFSGNIDFGSIKDTVAIEEDVDDIIQLPSELGFGVSLGKHKKWLLAVDYKTSNWGAIESNDALYSYKSNFSLAAGVEITPQYDGNNYLQRIAYRFGARHANSYITINDMDWSEYGITFGLGLPVRKAESSYPRLNLGFEYGNRGTTDGGLLKEQFFNFNVGITINAVWFRKRKYD